MHLHVLFSGPDLRISAMTAMRAESHNVRAVAGEQPFAEGGHFEQYPAGLYLLFNYFDGRSRTEIRLDAIVNDSSPLLLFHSFPMECHGGGVEEEDQSITGGLPIWVLSNHTSKGFLFFAISGF